MFVDRQEIAGELLEEQSHIQVDKMRTRGLLKYNAIIFSPLYTNIFTFVDAVVPDAQNLEGVLEGLAIRHSPRKVHWADMAGGFAISMRQVAQGLAGADAAKIAMSCVDLFDWEEEFDEDGIKKISELHGVDMRDKQPNLIVANAETVDLREPADVITSVEGIQYFHNPLAALANWYNQLNENGLLFVARSRLLPWSGNVTQADTTNEQTLFTRVFDNLTQNGVSFVAEGPGGKGDPDFSLLALRRKEGTRLQQNAEVLQVTTDTDDYKVVVYTSDSPALEVVLS